MFISLSPNLIQGAVTLLRLSHSCLDPPLWIVTRAFLSSACHLGSRFGEPGGYPQWAKVGMGMIVVVAFVEDEAGRITGESTWALVFLSRSLNVLTGGSPRELFCARAHRKGWAMCKQIDALFRFIRSDDKEHCRACFLSHKRAARLRHLSV